MLRSIVFTALAFGFVSAGAPSAEAALCFQYTKSGGGVSVAQAEIPAPNRCTAFALYEVGTKPGTTLLGAGNGSLCTSTNSNFVIYHYTYEGCMPLGGDNYFESGTCRLDLARNGGLPTEFSVCRGALITGKPGQPGKAGNFFNHDDLVITNCDADNDIQFQVPSGLVAECWTELRLRQGAEQPSEAPEQSTRGAAPQ